MLTEKELEHLTNTYWNAPHVVSFVTNWNHQEMPDWVLKCCRQFLEMSVVEQRKHYVVNKQVVPVPTKREVYKLLNSGTWQKFTNQGAKISQSDK